MKTLLLSSVVLAGLVASAPASAQFASTGDSIFGREYRTEASTKAANAQDLSIGYTETVSQERTGSVKAVQRETRGEKTAPRATTETVRDNKVDTRR